MWGLAGWPSWASIATGPSLWGLLQLVALLLWVLAVTLMAAALRTMQAANTTPNPVLPERAATLVQHGLFAYSRNPIYLADALVLVGWACWLGSAKALLVLPVFLAYISVMQIRAEEQALSKAFGNDYLDYCARVRPWL